MNTTYRLVAARTLSLFAVAAAIAIPWFGWAALAVAVALVIVGAVLLPPAATPAHEGRLRHLRRAIQRRVVRHPWRMRHP
jgi:membrane-bound lytic murein transglycosylase